MTAPTDVRTTATRPSVRSSRASRSAIRHAGPPSRPVQLFAVLALLHASGAFFAVATPSGDETSPVVLLVWVVLYAAAAAGLLDGVLRQRRAVPVSMSLAVFVALVFASVLWSTDASLTLKRAVGLLGTVLVGVFLAQRLRPVDALHALRRAMVVIAASSLLLFLSGSGAALDEVHGTLRGVVATKNALGRDMALGVLACVGALLVDRSAWRSIVASAPFLLAALALTDSTAGLALAVLALVGGAIAVFAGRTTGRVLLAGVAVMLAGLTSITIPTTTTEQLASAVGEDTTLTGRDAIWAESVDAMRDDLAVGRGYGVFWEGTSDAERIRARLGWDVPHAHNGLLDVGLDLGLLGVAVAVAVLLALLVHGVRDLRARRRSAAALRLSVAGVLLISNTVESGILQQNGLLTLLLVVALSCRERLPVALPDRRPALGTRS